MWLRYGFDSENTLVAIEDVPSGNTLLRCPYCGGRLTAKKGLIKQHHFAHTELTCGAVRDRYSQEILTLPLYNKFNTRLSGSELEQLKILWQQYGAKGCKIPKFLVPNRFIWLGLLREIALTHPEPDYEFTHLGKTAFGGLPLMLFNELQEPLLLEKLFQLEQKARALGSSSYLLTERLIDFKIYRAQIRKILLNTLYYLEVQADGDRLYKIGITQRPITERLIEVQRDLKKHFKTVDIKVLGTWEHRGNVEYYFKHRYRNFNYKIGKLTEYYKFDHIKTVLQDLNQMKPKVLTEVEMDILANKYSSIEL